jgi:biopolymer transport protein TolR
MAMGPLPSSRSRNRRTPMAEINVTPMVDVMLVLLVIFMVTAPLLVSGVPVNLPDSNAQGLTQQEQPLQVSLDDKGGLFLDAEAVTKPQLIEKLSAAKAKAGAEGPQVYLRGDKKLGYGQVAEIMGLINSVGITRLALVTTSGEAAAAPANGEAAPSGIAQ